MAARSPLCDTRLAAVEQGERRIDRLAHCPFGGGPDAVAVLECMIDDFRKLGMRH